jgi:hypothetical protein
MSPHPPFHVRPLAYDDLAKLLALYAHLHRADDPLPAQKQVELEPIEIQVSRPRTSTDRGMLRRLLLWQQFGTIVIPVTKQIPNFTLYDAIFRAVECRNGKHGCRHPRPRNNFPWQLGG